MKRIRINTAVKPSLLDSSHLVMATELADGGLLEEPIEPPSYIERMAEQRKQWKEADKAKFYNPSRDPEADKVWVVYAWLNGKNRKGRWHCLGERAKKPGRRKPMTMNRLFAGIRTRFGLLKEVPVLLVSRQDDRARISRNEEHAPPKHHDTLRPHRAPDASLKLEVLAPTPKRKVKKDTAPKVQLERKVGTTSKVMFTFKTRYVAWGRMPGREWYFLGAAEDGTRKGAAAEIKTRYPMYADLKVLEVKALKYSLRSRIMDGRLRAGVSKDTPPGSGK